MATAPTVAQPWTARRNRASELASRHSHADELLRLYLALCEVWEPAWQEALVDPPGRSRIAAFAAARVLPGVVEAALEAGPEPLRQAALSRFHEANPEQLLQAWLDGGELSPVDTFLARAATAPILEADPKPGLAAAEGDKRHCPACGGLPQLAYFQPTGDPLLTAPRQLLCSRCSASWSYPRLVCAGCGSDDSPSQPIFADVESFPHLRVDACERCRQYLLTVELTKDPAAVPVVDELAGVPLDLYARERGFSKITANLMGI